MTRLDLIDLFLKTLLKEIGGNRRRWAAVLGEVRVYDVATHPHCNWSVSPRGGIGENAAVERIADRLRGEVPIVTD